MTPRTTWLPRPADESRRHGRQHPRLRELPEHILAVTAVRRHGAAQMAVVVPQPDHRPGQTVLGAHGAEARRRQHEFPAGRPVSRPDPAGRQHLQKVAAREDEDVTADGRNAGDDAVRRAPTCCAVSPAGQASWNRGAFLENLRRRPSPYAPQSRSPRSGSTTVAPPNPERSQVRKARQGRRAPGRSAALMCPQIGR